jgi:leader peptidase (prepilin peptidase) / N-methyltransferase
MSAGMDTFYSIIAVVSGLMLGSFFNVLIYRLPRKESIVRPGSHCPQCGRGVKPWENIPLLSFLILGGKCAGCKNRITIRYPIIEFLTAAAAFLIYSRLIVPAAATPISAWKIVALAMQISVLLIIVPVAVIDLFHFIIPDSITLPGLILAILVSFFPEGLSPLQCLYGILAGGGSLFCIGIIGEWAFKKGEAMGGGDVKLMALCGAVFGWKLGLLTIVLAAFIGSIVGIGLVLFKVFSKDHKIPFGPFLACGLWASVLAGDPLLSLYRALIDRFIGY